jgi:hypothetical protein
VTSAPSARMAGATSAAREGMGGPRTADVTAVTVATAVATGAATIARATTGAASATAATSRARAVARSRAKRHAATTVRDRNRAAGIGPATIARVTSDRATIARVTSDHATTVHVKSGALRRRVASHALSRERTFLRIVAARSPALHTSTMARVARAARVAARSGGHRAAGRAAVAVAAAAKAAR